MSSKYPSSNDRDWNLLQKIANNTAEIADLQAAGVSSIAGTSHQITASSPNGAVTLSLPASVYGITSLGVNTGATAPLTELQVSSTSTSSPRGIMSSQYTTDTMGARLGFTKARGTQATPTTIVTGDNIGRLNAWPYDGTNYLEMASIIFGTEGTIATNRTPTNISFWTATNAQPSVNTQRLIIDSSGNFTASTGAWWLNNATGGMPGAGVINAKGFQIDGVAVATSTDTYWNINTGTLWYTGGGVNLTGNGTLAAGALKANSVTAAASTDLTLAGGSSGASLVLGQLTGGTTANISLTPVGTAGGVGIGTSSPGFMLDVQKTGAGGTTLFSVANTTAAGTSNGVALYSRLKDDTAGLIQYSAIYTVSTGVTSAGNAQTGDMRFYVKTAGDSAVSERMRLVSTGNLLIGGTTDITGTGGLKVFGTTDSTAGTVATGAFQVLGGASFSKGVNVGTRVNIIDGSNPLFRFYEGATPASSISSFGGDLFIGIDQNTANSIVFRRNSSTEAMRIAGNTGVVSIAAATASTSTTTGALVVGGGVGVAGAAFIAGAITSTTAGFQSALTSFTGDNILRGVTNLAEYGLSGGVAYLDAGHTADAGAHTVGFQLRTLNSGSELNTLLINPAGTTLQSGSFTVSATTDSTSSSTGALVVTGGAGIGKNLSTGGGRIKHTKIVTATYTQDTTTVDEVLVGNHATVAFTITLLAAGAAGMTGRSLVIKNRGAATVTVAAAAAASEIFSTSAVSSVALTVGQSVTLVSDGVYWNVC